MFTYYPHAINVIGMDWTKEFFQNAWGEKGYYENFSYGVGIGRVCEVALIPFLNLDHTALEIGSGGGVFTERIHGNFANVTAIDVIKMPIKFEKWRDFKYIELPTNSYDCANIPDNSIDFCFCYNVFCHLSNESIKKYVTNVHRILKAGGNFVFMLANYKHTKKNLDKEYQFGELTSVGHFYQDERTVDIIADKQWEIVSSNMIPEHRDIIVHLKKK